MLLVPLPPKMTPISSTDPVLRFIDEMLAARPVEWSGPDTCPLCGLPVDSLEKRHRMLRELPPEALEALAVRHWFGLENHVMRGGPSGSGALRNSA